MTNLRIYIAGHNGMVGSALYQVLKDSHGIELITKDRKEIDLVNQTAVHNFFKKEKIDQVYFIVVE